MFSKFFRRMSNLGKQRFPNSLKSQVRFGPGTPPWSQTAMYLGLLFDKKLSFVDTMNRTHERITDRTRFWRLFSHTDRVTGSSPRTLEIIFKVWFLPLIEYASPIWIFRIRDFRLFHISAPVLSEYSKAFTKLNTFYMKCARNILGVPPVFMLTLCVLY